MDPLPPSSPPPGAARPGIDSWPSLSILSSSSLPVAELSVRTGLVKSTIMRLFVSLEGAGLLHRTEET